MMAGAWARPAAAAAFVVAAAGCGGAKSPVTESPLPGQVAVSVAPEPLVATSMGGTSSRYRIPANLNFRETAGVGVVVTQLKVSVTLASGETGSASYTLTVPVTAGGTTSYALESVFELPGAATTGRWRLETSGTGPGNTVWSAGAVEAGLVIGRRMPEAILVGAGDIARCNDPRPEATATLLDQVPGPGCTAGDNVYPYGTPDSYHGCYGPTWGRHLARTYATPGNHDWGLDAEPAYFAYFGQAAGPAGMGYYTYQAGGWDVIAINSNIPMAAGSPQYEWLRSVLASLTRSCTVAIFHHPLFSSSLNGNTTAVRDAWRLLYQAGVEIVVNGHDHTYERFAPQDPDGKPTDRGIREFIVGTGGDSLYDLKRRQANSEVFEHRTHGVLKLTLKDGSYEWEFIPVAGQAFRDFGSGACVAR